jgi:hypothetical protein
MTTLLACTDLHHIHYLRIGIRLNETLLYEEVIQRHERILIQLKGEIEVKETVPLAFVDD